MSLCIPAKHSPINIIEDTTIGCLVNLFLNSNLKAKSLNVYATGHRTMNHRYLDPFFNEINGIIIYWMLIIY